jgi:NADPH:quinone reductase-like Zn-dependent oxidoreductase
MFFDMIINKDIKINIDHVIKIDDIKKAQSLLERRLTTGSVVLYF